MRKIGFVICSMLLMLQGGGYASEPFSESEPLPESEFIPAGDRAVLESSDDVQLPTEEPKEGDLIPMAVYQTSHPGALHTTFKNWDFGTKVELNDGSIWAVSTFERWKINTWSSSDVILVKLNQRFLASHQYELVNQRTGDYVDVDLVELEVLPYDATFYGQRSWIIAVDYLANNVILQDGSLWDISYGDDAAFRTWRVGDVIILGVNDSWDASIRPNLLINFNTLTHARANCLN